MSMLKHSCLWQCFTNPFLTASAVSCLNMNGMIRTSRSRSSKEWLLCFLCFPLPFPSPAASCKSKSRLGFNDSRSWSFSILVTAGGVRWSWGVTVNPACYPLLCVVLPIGDQPPSCLVRTAPPSNIGAVNKPSLPLLLRPSPHGASCKSAICSLFLQGQPSPPSCRLNLHTKNQCKRPPVMWMQEQSSLHIQKLCIASGLRTFQLHFYSFHL